ncbi:hypothetical protein HCTV-15_gp32 [Haloarcula virus HCTV-15]|uniref:Uncharacterized protein n=1 Tax=Halorubrum sodomense tailed virus 2 TaxID=1262527 RepID=L7THJ0_9CAUD|nr:hypothetical protein HSTV2_32 [Halorubrum sodomense tailed virus 2]AGC34301.1 hypothetical protein HSTV2_32 [Halorubrum sodomense tailed virus 2]UBF22289.1 hypothetical protein HRTV-11_gp32 [Halorubrum virus HRTV-11]UBF22399.1 hypothetical protein HCTV-6_gp32 [Haloarcula virus HCTV-6]UBF22506.1 hypothetical protein HCTV-15_gp32 [Haloarcula virus HCTV-15]
MKLGANVEFECSNGGSIRMVGNATDLGEIGTDEGWAFYDDLYINTNTALTLDLSGVNFVQALLETRDGATVMMFGIQSREPNGTADIRLTGLLPETWYRLQFDGALAETASGRSHGQSTPSGELQFNEVSIPNE